MDEATTRYYSPVVSRTATLLILDARKKPIMVSLSGDMTLGREYTNASTDIRVYSEIVGRRHGEFVYDSTTDDYYYIDNNSTNGSYINGFKLPSYNERGSRAYKLSDGDVIRIDRAILNNPHPQSVLIIFSRNMDLDEKWQTYRIENANSITIGRSKHNSICLHDMMSSREHAVINMVQSGMTIFDKGSQNGTIVNGIPLNGPRPLYNHDVIKIASTLLVVMGDEILYNNPGERAGTLSVYIHKKDVNFGRKTLIKDIRFEADTGDFILILGGSGAGKTTLVNAILGDGKAEGPVILDGQNLYEVTDWPCATVCQPSCQRQGESDFDGYRPDKA